MSFLEVAVLTNIGLVRKFNEDAVLIGSELISENEFGPTTFTLGAGPLVIADGMGGHRNGVLASRTALSAIRKGSPISNELGRWENALQLANDAVYDVMERDPSYRGMGTTIAGAVVGRDNIVHFNVGDSRVYRYSGGELFRLSQDDVPLATASPSRRLSHQITQSLGGRSTRVSIRPHVGSSPHLDSDDILLICSDGLTDMVPDRLLSAAIAEEQNLGRCLRILLELAFAEGGRDNISIIMARPLQP